MYTDLMRLVNALKWSNVAKGGLERKEQILLTMRDLINSELRKVRAEKKKTVKEEE